MLTLLLACRADFPCADDQLLSADGDCLEVDSDTDDTVDTDDTDDTDTDTDDTDTDDTGDTAVPPSLTILAPSPATELLVGTRYDLVVLSPDAESAEAVIGGAKSSCAPLTDGILHCGLYVASEGTVEIAVSAEAGGAGSEASLSLPAREASGVVPEGERFAMGMYEVMAEDWFAPVAGAGFELAQSYGTGGYTHDEWQGWAADAGMLTMARTSWSWSDPWGDPYTDEELAEVAKYPQIAWWELPDNLVGDGSYADEVSALVDRIRKVDDRPVYMYLWTSTTTEQIEAYVPYLDLIAPGAYPEHACQPQPWIRWRITSAVEAVHNQGFTTAEKPVIGLADLYGRPDPGCEAAQLPQVRMNPLAQIAAGATGVLYFAWWYAENALEPEWGELALHTAGLITGEAGLGEAVVRGESLGDLDVTVLSGPELSESFTPYGLSESFQYPSIHAAAWDYAGTRFIVAVNYTDSTVEARIGGLPSRTPGVEVVGEEQTLVPESGEITVSFEGWGAHVFRAPIADSP
jgi:hypothetical protein